LKNVVQIKNSVKIRQMTEVEEEDRLGSLPGSESLSLHQQNSNDVFTRFNGTVDDARRCKPSLHALDNLIKPVD